MSECTLTQTCITCAVLRETCCYLDGFPRLAKVCNFAQESFLKLQWMQKISEVACIRFLRCITCAVLRDTCCYLDGFPRLAKVCNFAQESFLKLQWMQKISKVACIRFLRCITCAVLRETCCYLFCPRGLQKISETCSFEVCNFAQESFLKLQWMQKISKVACIRFLRCITCAVLRDTCCYLDGFPRLAEVCNFAQESFLKLQWMQKIAEVGCQ